MVDTPVVDAETIYQVHCSTAATLTLSFATPSHSVAQRLPIIDVAKYHTLGPLWMNQETTVVVHLIHSMAK